MKITVFLAATLLLFSQPGQGSATESVTVPMANAKGESLGAARLTQTPQGVLIQVDLAQLPPGVLAFHVHETGKCEPTFAAAGDHFNPESKKHGLLDPAGRHAGDLPNVHVPESGKLKVDILATQLAWGEGKTSLFDADGSALVLHARPDDYRSDPAGNAGDRIACGAIRRPAT